MRADAVVVLDAGKTLSKLTLWTLNGAPVERRTRRNATPHHRGWAVLDTDGIEEWLAETLSEFVERAEVKSFVPVGHGAAAAIVRDGKLVVPPLDYEQKFPAELHADYDAQRDPFALTGSPRLPGGLNLGAQLHALEKNDPDILDGATILPWAQYWAWLLSGVAASEVSSLGCHTDLWWPAKNVASKLAKDRGWAAKLAPLRHAADPLGPMTGEWSERIGHKGHVEVYCGLHDFNAALLAARSFPEFAGQECTVLSTGTWFVAMRSPENDFDIAKLPSARDCLVNVDVSGKSVPSARWMGGREAELLLGTDTREMDQSAGRAALLDALPGLLATESLLRPSFVAGTGPFPDSNGRWVGTAPANTAQKCAAVYLYLAMMTEALLELIGAKHRLLVEGRFAESELFVRALASLMPQVAVYVANAHNDVSYGAMRLLKPNLPPSSVLRRIHPLDHDLGRYRDRWRALVKADLQAGAK